MKGTLITNLIEVYKASKSYRPLGGVFTVIRVNGRNYSRVSRNGAWDEDRLREVILRIVNKQSHVTEIAWKHFGMV